MKQPGAILLIAIFLFNLFGYRLVFNYAQQQSDVRLEASFDKNDFEEADLIAIKVPLSLPYLNDQQNFERIDGEITVKGKIYKYVKRKITNGNLVLLCLPDHNKMSIESAKHNFFKNANDIAQNDNSKKSNNSKGFFKNLTSDYDYHITAATRPFSALSDSLYYLSPQLNYLPSSPHSSPEQPPEFL
ncbi:hypothetical protein [Segetibacter sp.]|uniref:hypothetical protein n=1 Tax=Segetibacter sp. TaxID=2231182 RepID=UPI00262FFF2E|nr:hypothetical protein [Segetibacter sp.]MCW3079921.1 hypothetical protein [Segetibacter sp.]